MKSQLLSRRELEFLLYEWLEQQQLCHHPRFELHNRETFDAALDIGERIATDLFSAGYASPSTTQTGRPLNPARAAYDALADAGMLAASQDFAQGGMQLPHSIQAAGLAYLLAANYSQAIYALLAMCCANILLRLNDSELAQNYAKALLNGSISASLALSDDGLESTLSGIQTRAWLQEDGRYHLLGRKTWVLGATPDLAKPVLHFVLARIVDKSGQVIAGGAGVSLFVVPQETDEIRQTDPGSLTCQAIAVPLAGCAGLFADLHLQQTPVEAGALGLLLGSPHRGLAYVLPALNEIRLVLGLASSALANRLYQQTLSYFRQSGQVLASAAKANLLQAKAYAEGAMAFCLFCSSLLDQEKYAPQHELRQQARLLMDLLLPVAKAWPAYAAQKLVQLTGDLLGLGLLDSQQSLLVQAQQIQLCAIQQGGAHVQAQDLVQRKIGLSDGVALELLGERIHKTLSQASRVPVLAGYAKELARLVQKLAQVTQQLSQTTDQQRAHSLAVPYIESFGSSMVAWIWLEQALHSYAHLNSEEAEFYHGKIQACRYYYRWEIPQIHGKLEPLLTLDNAICDMQTEWF